MQLQTLEGILHHPPAVVCHGGQGVVFDAPFAIQYHVGTVRIVLVVEGKSVRTDQVKEAFLGLDVGVEVPVVIEVVVRDIRENSSGQLGACESVLVDAMGTRFHENVLATGVRHATEQLLHLQGVGRGVAGRDNFVEHAVFNRRKHTGSAVHGTEQAVEQADRCSFPVGSRDCDHLHRGTGVVVKLRSDVAQCNPRVHDPDVGDVLGALLGQALADNRRCALGGRLFDEVMSVNTNAGNGDK